MKRLAWRVQSDETGSFDELVVGGEGDHDALIHAEMMDERSIFVSIGPLDVWAHVAGDGEVEITHTETRPAKARGEA